jgi:iron complex transport system permease protein
MAESAATPATILRPPRVGRSRLLLGAACLLGAGLIGVLVGPAGLRPSGVLRELVGRMPFVHVDSGLTPREATILWQLRLPRVVLGGLVGAMLALAGAAYQGVFRNALADPYLLGAAAGAGLGATLAIVYLPAATSGWPIDPLPLAAFVGALVGVIAAYTLGRAAGKGRTASTLVLAGVAVASFLTAIQTYVQQREAGPSVQRVYSWILGRLGTVGWSEVWLIVPYVAVSTATILLHRRLLDVMSVGDEEATSLGVRVARVRLLVVVAASLGTAAAVAVSGLIAFVGIIVPHTVRLLFGSSYRVVLPLSFVFGAAFLILADVLARTVAAPAELPIGVITAFCGAPFFLVVLRTGRRMS